MPQPTLRAASGAAGTAATSQTLTKPTGSASGDFVVFVVHVANDADTPTVSTGWTITERSVNTGNSQSGLVYRLLDGGANDADPTYTWTTSSRWAWDGIGFQPGGGGTISIAAEATVTVDTTAATTHTAGSATPATSQDVSVLLFAPRAQNSGATAVTTTPPTNWTEPTNGDQSTASGAGAKQVSAETSYRLLASASTVSPGAHTTTAQTDNTTTANVHHVILTESSAAPFPPWRTLQQAVYRM